MRFDVVHKSSTYAMVTSAVLALVASPDISLLAAVLSLVAIAISWFVNPKHSEGSFYGRAWTAVTVVFLLLTAVWGFQTGSVISAGIHFLLFILVNKLFNRRESRDYLQAYLISLMMMIAATTVNTSLVFAACFIAYVLFSTWALSLLHLRRDIERNMLVRHQDGSSSTKITPDRMLSSRRVVTGRYLASTALLSLVMAFGAAGVFVLFPRLGFGFFTMQKRSGLNMVGFNEQVQLGKHGTIRDNPDVVMRVIFGSPAAPKPPPPVTLRWRGTAFDKYENGGWSQSEQLRGEVQALRSRSKLFAIDERVVPIGRDGRPRDPERARKNLLPQYIYLEPLNSDIIFGLERLAAVATTTPKVAGKSAFVLRRNHFRETKAIKRRSSAIRYIAYSKLSVESPADLRRAKQTFNWSMANHYLDLPGDLPPRIGELARKIVEGKKTVYDQVKAIENHLRTKYQYTTKLTHDPKLEPIDEFLFVNKRGHCEYFASAMALMLRTVGIHSRQVNGFVGGEWNAYGNYLAVRQGDAHAWVEVHFQGMGWVPFDPTPPASRPATQKTSGFMSAMRQMVDALKLRWYNWIVEFNFDKQVKLFDSVRRVFTRKNKSGRLITGDWKRPLGWVGAGASVLIALFLLWRWRKRFLRGKPAGGAQVQHPASVLYRRVLKLLAQHGYAKKPGQTPREFAASLVDHPASDTFGRITQRYYDWRYAAVAESQVAELEQLVEQLNQLLAAHNRDKPTVA